MNAFDIGVEVFIVPALWSILILTVSVMIGTSFTRHKTIIEDEDGESVSIHWTRNGSRIRRALGLLGIGALVLASLVVVPPGHRGAIYTTSGVSTSERGEGYSLMIPILNNANMVNVREQLYSNEEVYGQTADVLEVTMQVGVNYRINPEQAADIFKEVGQQYETAIIENAVLDVGKAVIGQYDAGTVPSSRTSITADMTEGLRNRLGPVGIDVTFVALRDIILPSTFVSAVEAKEVAQERQEESLRLVTVAENEADAAIKAAEGQATALETVAAAEQAQQALLGLSPTEYVWYKRWNGTLPSTYLSDGTGFIVNLPDSAPAPASE